MCLVQIITLHNIDWKKKIIKDQKKAQTAA